MIKFFSKIKKLERVKRIKAAWREGDEIKTEYEDRGWYMLLEGSWESLFIGFEEPEGIAVGDEVEVLIQKKTLT